MYKEKINNSIRKSCIQVCKKPDFLSTRAKKSLLMILNGISIVRTSFWSIDCTQDKQIKQIVEHLYVYPLSIVF
jgi:hypothetical protein